MQARSSANHVLTAPAELPLSQIAAINPEDALLLEQQGIVTNLDLLGYAGRHSERPLLAEQLAVTVQQVNRWVILADLARVPSVGATYCDFLLQMGICSTVQLARTPMEDLQRTVSRFQMPILQQAELCPDMGLIATWIGQARQLMNQQGVTGLVS